MRRITSFLGLLVLLSCGPPKDHLTGYQRTGTYPIKGYFREPIAIVMIERNGLFDVAAAMGSAFLLDKNQGLFSTARHVVDLDIEYKLYFCGKVYRANRKLDSGVTDVGFLTITSDFNPSDFPEPYVLATAATKGDRAFMRGIHLHPEDLQKNRAVHQILEAYYGITSGMMFGGRFQKQEFVYDNLPSKIVDLDLLLRNSDIEGIASEELRNVVQLNWAVQANEDHIISFGGLSGGPTVNEGGEVVGINSNELGAEGKTILERDGQLHYYPRVTLRLLPVDELKLAMIRLNLNSR